jgi:hypothetical protein
MRGQPKKLNMPQPGSPVQRSGGCGAEHAPDRGQCAPCARDGAAGSGCSLCMEHQCGEGVALSMVAGNKAHRRGSSTVRRRHSNSGELPQWSAAARGAPVAPCEREGCEAALIEEAPNDGGSHHGGGRKHSDNSVGVKSGDVEALR